MTNTYMNRWNASPRARRSRVDWAELTGSDFIAMRQVAWERGRTALAMRNAGLTLDQIANRFGISPERVRQIVNRAARWRSRPSPIEVWMDGANCLTLVLSCQYTARGIRHLSHSLIPLISQAKRDWLLIASRTRQGAAA